MRHQSPPSATSPNRLLKRLSSDDFELLRPGLEPVQLQKGDVCIEPLSPISHIYFLEGGLGSTVVPDEDHGTAEIGMQGLEGLIGVPALLGADRSPHKVFMQVGGPAQRIESGLLREAMERSPSLRQILLLYAQVFLIQTGQTAYVNARYNIEERLARWVLMAADRLGPVVPLTHEYLSYMLGVRRAGVTVALHLLEGDGLIRSTRGLVEILDRPALEAKAKGSYGVPEAEYERLIGP